MFLVIGGRAVPCNGNAQIALIGIDGSHADAGMGVDAAQNHMPGAHMRQPVFKVCPEESAVALLDNDRISGPPVEIRMKLRAARAHDGGLDVALTHFGKGIAEPGLELLTHSDDGKPGHPEGSGQPVGLRNQLRRSPGVPAVEKVVEQIDDDETM